MKNSELPSDRIYRIFGEDITLSDAIDKAGQCAGLSAMDMIDDVASQVDEQKPEGDETGDGGMLRTLSLTILYHWVGARFDAMRLAMSKGGPDLVPLCNALDELSEDLQSGKRPSEAAEILKALEPMIQASVRKHGRGRN